MLKLVIIMGRTVSPLLPVIVIVFIDLLGFGIVIPILPYYAESLGAGGMELGFLMALYSGLQFLIAPFWGALSDRIGRKPVLLGSLLAASGALAATGFADTTFELALARGLAGFFAANIPVAYAYVADVTTPENRARGMGFLGAAFGLGFIAGPAIGGALSVYGFATPFFFVAALGLLNTLIGAKILLEPPRTALERTQNRPPRGIRTILQIVSSSQHAKGIGLFFLITLALTQMETVFALFMMNKYGLQAPGAGVILGLAGIAMAAAQGGLAHRAIKRLGEMGVTRWASIFCALSLVAFSAANQVSLAALALMGMAFSHGMAHPALSSYVSLKARENERGLVMGAFHSASSLARVLGPPISGLLFDHMGMTTPFIASAMICVLAAVFSRTLL